MADETIIAVREAAAAYAQAVRATQRFFDDVEDTTDPGLIAEYANLAQQEKRALEARLDAIEEAGFAVSSIDDSDRDD